MEKYIELTEKNVPDDSFRHYLEQDLLGGTRLTPARISKITSIDCSKRGIKCLQGLEMFTEIESLVCSGNPELKRINLSNQKKLNYLDFSNTGVSSIETPDDCLGFFDNLHTLNVGQCNGLISASLTVLLSSAPNLKTLVINKSEINEIPEYFLHNLHSLNISECKNLTDVDFTKMPNLKTITAWGTGIQLFDLRANKDLRSLYISEEVPEGQKSTYPLVKIIGLQEAKQLITLCLCNVTPVLYKNWQDMDEACVSDALTAYPGKKSDLDLSDFISLTNLFVPNSNLGSLILPGEGSQLQVLSINMVSFNETVDFSNSVCLRQLGAEETKMDVLDLRANKKLCILTADNSDIKEILASGVTELKTICVPDGNLSVFDVSNCKNLKEVKIPGNKMLKTVNVKKCLNLNMLNVNNCGIEKIDTSDCVELKELLCRNTKIAELDVSKNKNILNVDFQGSPVRSILGYDSII